MNKKIIYTMLIVLGVLLVFWVVLKNTGGPTTQPESLTALDIQFDAGKAAKIDVYKQEYPDSGLHFAKIDTSWVVTNAFNAPAKSSEIVKFLADLDSVSGQIRAESADLYEDFDITDERALQIEIFDSEGSKLLHIYVGKGSGGQANFLRVAGSPTVYLADRNFISRFAAWNAEPERKLPTSRWVELSLCSIPREMVKSFALKMNNKEFGFALIEEPVEDSLAPPTEVWTQVMPEKGTKLDEGKIKRLQSTVVSLRATDVADPANMSKFGLENPAYSVSAADNSGRTVQIYFSKPFNSDKDRYVVVDGVNALYMIKENTFNRIFEDPFKE